MRSPITSAAGRPRPDGADRSPRSILAALAILIVGSSSWLASGAPALAAPDPLACTGYPEPRVFIESQAWWRPLGQTGFGEHIHLGTCFPIGQMVRGTLELDLRVMLHDQLPGSRVTLLRAGTESVTLLEQSIDLRPDASGHATAWYHVGLDTRKVAEGRREFRFTANMSARPDGKRQFETSGWQTTVDNDPAVAGSNYRSHLGIEARGWYSGANYTNARLDAPPPATVSGTWTFNVRLDAGSGGTPVTAHSVHVDPDFHAGSAGRVLRSGVGAYRGAVSIDTKTLTNGRHKLVLISHSDIATGRASGIQVVTFNVSN